MKPQSKKLFALTTAALALPSLTPSVAKAQSAPVDFDVSYRFSTYSEGEVSPENNLLGAGQSVDRFDIDIHQLGIVAPLSSRWSLNFDASTESLSGASPWFVQPVNGEAVQAFSGATIEETRNDVSVGTNYFADRFRIGGGVAFSTENDYEALAFNLSSSIFFNNKNTSIDFGISQSNDDITPTQDPTADPNGLRIISDTKSSQAVSVGFSQVLNKTTLIAGSLGFKQFDGFLSDPYKLVSVGGTLIPDARPDSKFENTASLQLRKFFTGIEAALHADYRFYDNDWGNLSNTVSLAWYQNLGSWQLTGRVRVYDQQQANFFSNFFEEARADGFHTSDYRLSSYSAISTKLSVKKSFGDVFSVLVSYEDYQTGSGFIGSDDELSPGLVEFDLISVGLNTKF